MPPALDIRLSVKSFAVSDGNIHNFEVQFIRAEEQIKVTEGIEVAEVSTVGIEAGVILFPHGLGAAQCVFDWLSQKPRKDQAESLVRA